MKLRFSVLAACAALAVVSLVAQSQAPNTGKGDAKGKAKGGGGAAKGNSVGLYQRQPPAPTGPAPKLADGTPDFSGAWVGGGANDGDISRSLKPGDSVVMLPWAEGVVKERLSAQDPEANCLPSGIPRGSPYPWRIAQTPSIYFIVFEGNIHSWRQIFMDGRKQPDDPDPAWYGHSIGRWDGPTWVVDTVGFNTKFWLDYVGRPHTEKMHTVERYTRTDMANMAIEVTIEDPGTFVKPFTTVGRARLLPGGDLIEYICQEDNFDLQHLSGPAQGPGGQTRQ